MGAWEDAILLVRKSWVMSMVMKVMNMVTKVTATVTAFASMVSEFGLDACQHVVFGHSSVACGSGDGHCSDCEVWN